METRASSKLTARKLCEPHDDFSLVICLCLDSSSLHLYPPKYLLGSYMQVPVNTWQHPACCPVESICVLIPGTRTVPLASAHPFVYVAAGRNEVALWNAEDGTCHQVWGTIKAPPLGYRGLNMLTTWFELFNLKSESNVEAKHYFLLSCVCEPLHVSSEETLVRCEWGVLAGQCRG